MTCSYYYFCGGHKCSGKGRYGDRVSDSEYSSYCKWNGLHCPVLTKGKVIHNRNSNNPNNQNNNNSSCFITTIVSNILGKKDDDKVLVNLRSFRDEVLQNDSKYDEVLKSYDTIGPVIAGCIYNDKDKEKMADGLYSNALLPISNLVVSKEYDKACERYYLMTLALINYYGLKHYYNDVVSNDYGYGNEEIDRHLSGHGKKQVKVLKRD